MVDRVVLVDISLVVSAESLERWRLRSGFLRSAVHDVNDSGRNDGLGLVGRNKSGLANDLHPTLRKGAKDGAPDLFGSVESGRC